MVQTTSSSIWIPSSGSLSAALLIGVSAFACAPALAQETTTSESATAGQEEPWLPNEAAGQPTADTYLSDSQGQIIVTARRREETLIDVPVAVSALAAAEVTRYASTDLSRIAEQIPTVQITPASSGNGATIVIRGISSSSTDPGLESAVSVAIDGMQLSRGYITQAAFFDVGQVEVLKGPQALFFGKNSPAGVIALTSLGPTNELEGYVRAGYEFRANDRYLEAAVGGPLSETLGVRVAFRGSKMDGWLKNTSGPLANPIEPAFPYPGAVNNKVTPAARSLAGRVTLEYEPASNFAASLKVLYSDYRNNELTGLTQVVSCGAAGFPSDLGVPDPYADCKPDNRRVTGGYHPAIFSVYPETDGEFFSSNKSLLASLALSYDLEDIALNSITGIYDLKANGFGNYSGTTQIVFPGVNGENSRIYTQELRATSDFDAPVNFMFGVFFEDAKRESFTIGRGGFGPVPFDPNFGGASVLYYPDDFVWSNTYSAFGQVLWDITDRLQFSGGVRYTKEKKRALLENIYINPLVPIAVRAFLPVGTELRGRFEDSNWSPEVTLSWHPIEDQTLYAAYKTGYKSGGFSTTAVLLRSNTIESLTFGSETAKGWEVGYKAQFLNRALTFTSALYDYEFSDLQRSALDIATTSFLVRNAAEARTRGVEAEATFRASDAISLRASGAYNKAEFSSFPTAPCFNGQTPAEGCVGNSQDLAGQTIALAPRFTGTAGLSVDTPITEAIGIGFTADVRYVSKYRTQDDNAPGSTEEGYGKFNASVRVHEADDRWELALLGLNLFNTYRTLTSSNKPGGARGDLYGIVERGREVHLQATARF